MSELTGRSRFQNDPAQREIDDILVGELSRRLLAADNQARTFEGL